LLGTVFGRSHFITDTNARMLYLTITSIALDLLIKIQQILTQHFSPFQRQVVYC